MKVVGHTSSQPLPLITTYQFRAGVRVLLTDPEIR